MTNSTSCCSWPRSVQRSFVASSHFVSLFLGLELLGVALYGMIAYRHTRPLPLEAGTGSLVLAAASAAFLLFGMALIYGALGTMQFGEIVVRLARVSRPVARFAGPGSDCHGLGFKLAVVPFHLWTPRKSQGAPAPVTAYIATVSKGAMFALLLRFFYSSGAHALAPVFIVFSIITIASMVVGDLLALLQNNVKRILDDALNGRRYCAIRFRQLRRMACFQDRAHGGSILETPRRASRRESRRS